LVNSTVRMGTLMPTPSVSVPQMTLSSPAGRAARPAAVLRQHPGVVHADAVAHQARGLAEPGGEAEAADLARRSVLLLRVQTLMLISAWASSTAAAG
jgi:hypothetical protein